MAYGIVKVDNITFDNGGSDQNVTVSGLYRATTSGVTVSGTIAATALFLVLLSLVVQLFQVPRLLVPRRTLLVGTLVT
jgi:hypothetical protein